MGHLMRGAMCNRRRGHSPAAGCTGLQRAAIWGFCELACRSFRGNQIHRIPAPHSSHLCAVTPSIWATKPLKLTPTLWITFLHFADNRLPLACQPVFGRALDRHAAGVRVAGFVDGSSKMLPKRILAVMRALWLAALARSDQVGRARPIRLGQRDASVGAGSPCSASARNTNCASSSSSWIAW